MSRHSPTTNVPRAVQLLYSVTALLLLVGLVAVVPGRLGAEPTVSSSELPAPPGDLLPPQPKTPAGGTPAPVDPEAEAEAADPPTEEADDPATAGDPAVGTAAGGTSEDAAAGTSTATDTSGTDDGEVDVQVDVQVEVEVSGEAGGTSSASSSSSSSRASASSSASSSATSSATSSAGRPTTSRPTTSETSAPSRPTSSRPSATAAPTSTPPRQQPAGSGRLTWAPPRLDDPITIRVSADNDDLRLDDDRDYRIEMPEHALRSRGGLTISGGHDVVLIGGHIEAQMANGTARGLYLKNQTGTLHIEGLRLSGDQATEGINLDQRKGATVQLQNVSVGTVRGSYSGNHADVLQTWGGPDVLRVDRLEGWTQYQGFFLDPTKFHDDAPSHFDLRNVVLRDSGQRSAYLLWQSGNFPISTQDVTVVRNPGKPFPQQVLRSARGSWDDVQNGSSNTPSPLVGEPGTSYVSPGYRG